MKKIDFAFLVHPLSIDNFRFILSEKEPSLAHLSQKELITILGVAKPQNFLEIDRVMSITGKRLLGCVILCPLLPQDMVTMSAKVVLEKITLSAQIAVDRGARLLGLGGFTSIFSNQGLDLVDKINIAITTGNTYTASLVLDGISAACRRVGTDLNNSTVAIIGATGNIGSACARFLSKISKKVFLIARDEFRLKDLEKKLKNVSNAEIHTMQYVQDSVYEANIFLLATSATTALIDPSRLGSGSVVCDVSVPPNVARISRKRRPDIFIFEGGLSRIPFFNKEDKQIARFFPLGAIYGCLAETILLTVDNRIENYSIGRDEIAIEKIKEIKAIGEKHGFGLSDFICGEEIIL